MSIATFPVWFSDLLNIQQTKEDLFLLNQTPYLFKKDILRSQSIYSEAQQQTEKTFEFKWKKRDTFESEASLARVRQWLLERYGALGDFAWLKEIQNPILLDAGCGGGMSALEMWREMLPNLRYIGVDVSEAVEVAQERFKESKLPGTFLQCNLMDLPFKSESLDIIFSEGVLHHTDSTEQALKTLAKLLKPKGRFLFYVYRKKGPLREFTDDYIRDKLQDLTQTEAWETLMPLTRLGEILGKLDIEIEIPEAIQLLDIPAGKINLQRLIYWHVFKAFYRPELSLEEMNHINYDWYAPKNAHRQSLSEVRQWCKEANLKIESEVVEDAGITIIAQKMETLCAA